MKKSRLTDIVEAALEEEVSIKNVLIAAGAITATILVIRFVRKRQGDDN